MGFDGTGGLVREEGSEDFLVAERKEGHRRLRRGLSVGRHAQIMPVLILTSHQAAERVLVVMRESRRGVGKR